jgi:hypothetical protein
LFVRKNALLGTPLRKYKGPVSTKRHNMRIEDEPDNAAGSALSIDTVNRRNQFPERQFSLFVIGFHAGTISRKPGEHYGVFTPSRPGSSWRSFQMVIKEQATVC